MKKLIVIGLIMSTILCSGKGKVEVMTLTGKVTVKLTQQENKVLKTFKLKADGKEYTFSPQSAEKIKSYYNKTVTIAAEVDTEQLSIVSVESVSKKSKKTKKKATSKKKSSKKKSKKKSKEKSE